MGRLFVGPSKAWIGAQKLRQTQIMRIYRHPLSVVTKAIKIIPAIWMHSIRLPSFPFKCLKVVYLSQGGFNFSVLIKPAQNLYFVNIKALKGRRYVHDIIMKQIDNSKAYMCESTHLFHINEPSRVLSVCTRYTTIT